MSQCQLTMKQHDPDLELLSSARWLISYHEACRAECTVGKPSVPQKQLAIGGYALVGICICCLLHLEHAVTILAIRTPL